MTPSNKNELSHKRHELKLQGRFEDAILIQLQILKIAQQTGRIHDIANAWNMLSHLQQQSGQLAEAERSARQAIDTYSEETRPCNEMTATYEMKLAMILADQERYIEAVKYGRLAIEHFSEFHDPPTDFLRSRVDQVAKWLSACNEA